MIRPIPILALAACHGPCPETPGALEIRQLDLRGPATGEAAVITLPGGDQLLVDVGNDSHADTVREHLAGAVAWLLVTHAHEDHAGGLDDLADLLAEATRIEGLGTWDLGDGVTLEVFLHDGTLRTPTGDVDLTAEVPGMAADENAMSTAAILRYGAFAYLFAGDLTGGGKDTPDVEGAVVAHGLAVGDVDLLHLNHHGIRSSTSQAWVDWLLPADGRTRNAVVGANGSYLAAPAGEVLDRVAPRLGGGTTWVTRDGSLAGDHEAKRTLDADVVVSVAEGGGDYTICGETFAAD